MQQNTIIGVVGPIGSGKTEHAAKLYRSLNRAVVFNAANDQAYRTHATVLLEDDIKSLREELTEETFRICFDTQAVNPGPRGTIEYSNLSEFLSECYWVGNLTIILDEAHQICSPWSAPFMVLKCVRLGRHQNLDIIFVSQRFASVHRELTYNAHELHMFRLTEPRDLQGIADRCGEEVARNLPHMRRIAREGSKIVPGEILIWHAEDGNFSIE